MTCATVSLFPSSTVLNQNIFLEGVLQGQVSYQSPIYVELQDGVGVPITPTSSTLVGNTLTATLATPTPSGVALVRPTPAQGISWNTYDTGWRAQNGWYAYTPPAYPAKYAQLDTTGGVVNFFRLKTALTVNGVTSTARFVDLSGVQGWPALNNLNYAVLDKLTGLMFTRSPIGISGGAAGWQTLFTTAFNNSVTINGNTYSDWYMIGVNEAALFFGLRPNSGAWVDSVSSLTVIPSFPSILYCAEQFPQSGVSYQVQAYTVLNSSGGMYQIKNPNADAGSVMYIHDAKNLIS